jgi:hypothetical protein
VLGAVLSASLVFPVLAVKYNPGLQGGEGAFYSLAGNYGYIPTQPVSQMQVLSVSGTNVTASFVNFYPDGHISPNFWVDVFSGQRYNRTSTFFFAVASGLLVGDGIFNNWSNVTIQAARAFACGGVTRPSIGTTIYTSDSTVNIIWDQATGVLCDYSSTGFTNGKVLEITMLNSTIWSHTASTDAFTAAAEISALLGLPLVAIVLFVYVRRRRTRKNTS